MKSVTHLRLNSLARIENQGRVEVGTYCEFNGSTCINDDEFIIESNRLSINGNSLFTNNGVVSLLNATDGNMNINSERAFTNNGSINVAGRFTINSTSTVFNNYKIVVQGKTELNSGTTSFNSGYLRSASMIQINSGAAFILNDGSMLSTPQFLLYRSITGSGKLNSI